MLLNCATSFTNKAHRISYRKGAMHRADLKEIFNVHMAKSLETHLSMCAFFVGHDHVYYSN